MTDFKRIYREEAEQYERLVSREDYQGQIERALHQIRPFDNLDILELGAGTGRLTRLLAPWANNIIACDFSPQMLTVARAKLNDSGQNNWQILAADNESLPLAAQSADLAIAGWSLGHSVGWYPGHWQEVIGRTLSEMERLLRSQGTIIILETLGTFQEKPQPPMPGLAQYYLWLEGEHAFSSTWIRTDYRFASMHEAVELIGFFFGGELAAAVQANDRLIVPECTGIWWRTII
jgi:ubiquinone/menaquinone biosynthesis C-methylase UbiE